jgi:RNA polymerase sigma-70 factor (ECF subfamily)
MAMAFETPGKKPGDGGADTDDWGRLMAAGLDGEGGAYHRLLSEIHVWLRRYYARRLPPSMVEDATQEALIAVHTKRHTYSVDRPFRPWLAAIARYKWIDRLRSMGRTVTEELDETLASAEDHGSAVTSTIVLDDLLARLKPAQAQVIRLVKLQGFSIEEAAAASGQSASLVKVNIHRGLSRLTAVVQEHDRADTV